MKLSERRKKRTEGMCSECAIRPVAPGKKRYQQCIDAGNARKKAVVQERRVKGLCTWCGAPAVPGKSKCQKHLDVTKKYARDNYQPHSCDSVFRAMPRRALRMTDEEYVKAKQFLQELRSRD